ncbi:MULTISPECIES: methanethiol S-methyltransferase [unclassified Mycobacterium]|uniref:methanethiol S-methyltransferase n=1 Tax=unclassified Mycobacterium TaxID=2642494 RepID=UPI000801D1ED|nr:MULTISPECIES: methanethiol S-methyltransferase [unclassified Mycobacterium]OBG73973.1 hypothetical protein A5700_05660 [Mycobacterium sp. E1214]OBH24054.1 hypothetical protein A5693_09055 [Mycobacterium sp. E1319]
MKRYLTVGYGAAGYLLFLAAFLYLVAFLGNFWAPRTVDRGPASPTGWAVSIDAALLAVFGLQHSVMARPGFKSWWTRLVPPAVERSTYVVCSSVALVLLYWQWRPAPTVVWDVQVPAARLLLWAAFWLGWAICLAATFMINHFDLFGLRQVYLAWRAEPYTDIEFHVRLLYRLVRHPLMLGFVVAFWAVPTMTAGHLLFSLAMTGYIVIATQFEERDLLAALGDQYRDYRLRVPMLVPRPRRSRTARAG